MPTYEDDVNCNKILIETQITGQPIVAKMDTLRDFRGKRRITSGYGRTVAVSALSGKMHCAAGSDAADVAYCQAVMATSVIHEPFISAIAANAIFVLGANGRIFGDVLKVPSDPNPTIFWDNEPYGAYHLNTRSGYAILGARPNIIAALKFNGILEAWGGNYGYGTSGPDWSSYMPLKAMAADQYGAPNCYIIGIKENGYAVEHHTGPTAPPYWSWIQGYNGNIADVWLTNLGTHLLLDDGTVQSIGDGSINTTAWTDVIRICGVARSLMGLKDDGTVYYTGWNPSGCKFDVESWTDIIEISLQSSHIAMGVKADGSIVVGGSLKVRPVWQWVQTWNLNS